MWSSFHGCKLLLSIAVYVLAVLGPPVVAVLDEKHLRPSGHSLREVETVTASMVTGCCGGKPSAAGVVDATMTALSAAREAKSPGQGGLLVPEGMNRNCIAVVTNEDILCRYTLANKSSGVTVPGFRLAAGSSALLVVCVCVRMYGWASRACVHVCVPACMCVVCVTVPRLVSA